MTRKILAVSKVAQTGVTASPVIASDGRNGTEPTANSHQHRWAVESAETQVGGRVKARCVAKGCPEKRRTFPAYSTTTAYVPFTVSDKKRIAEFTR